MQAVKWCKQFRIEGRLQILKFALDPALTVRAGELLIRGNHGG